MICMTRKPSTKFARRGLPQGQIALMRRSDPLMVLSVGRTPAPAVTAIEIQSEGTGNVVARDRIWIYRQPVSKPLWGFDLAEVHQC